MLKQEQILEKLYHMPEEFKAYVKNKQWTKARLCREAASSIAHFLDLEENRINELFGSRQEEGHEIEGLFREGEVSKVYYHCAVKRKQIDAPPEEEYRIGDKIDISPPGPYDKFTVGIITDVAMTICTKSNKPQYTYELNDSGKYIDLQGDHYG